MVAFMESNLALHLPEQVDTPISNPLSEMEKRVALAKAALDHAELMLDPHNRVNFFADQATRAGEGCSGGSSSSRRIPTPPSVPPPKHVFQKFAITPKLGCGAAKSQTLSPPLKRQRSE